MRIPVGNFGQVVAQPASAPNIPAGAFVTGSAQAMQQAGQQLSGIGSDMMADLHKARTLRVMSESKNELFTLESEISGAVSRGELGADKAHETWLERSKKLMDARLEGVPALQREVVGAQLQSTMFSLAGRVRDVATKRTQDDIGGELAALGVSLERESDPATAATRFDQAVRAMGPSAGWTPARIETEINTFREKAYATKAYSLVNGARDSMAALTEVEKALNSDEFSALDPQRRATLLNTTAGYKSTLEQRQLAAAQRAELQAQKREREAGVVFSKLQALTTEGKIINPDYAASAAAKLAGTSFESALPQLLNQASSGTAFAMQPIADQKAALDAFDARANAQGWTPELQERRNALASSYEASLRDYGKDPLRAAVDRGVLPELVPLDMSGGVPSMVAGLQARMEQARTVGAQVGRPVSPLTPEEAGQFAELLKVLPNDQKATTMAELSSALGAPTLGAIAAQLDQKDRTLGLVAAFGDTRTGNGGLVSESLLRGQQAIKDKLIPEADISMWRADIAKEVRGAYASAEMEDAVIDAAVLARADAEVRREGRNVRRAIEAVSGGIIEFNGGRIPLPHGMDEDAFEKAIDGLTPQALQAQGVGAMVFVAGKPVPLGDFVQSLPQAKLRHAGQGLYTVPSGNGSVLNSDGKPILIRIGNGTR